MMSKESLIYFQQFIRLLRDCFDISAHKNLESGVDMVLLMMVLAVVTSAVGVVNSPGQLIIFPPTVSLVMWVSTLCGLMS